MKSSVFIITLAVTFVNAYQIPKVNWTALPLDQWWGPGDNSTQDVSIRPAQITFNETKVADLKSRLQNHVEFISPLKDSAFTYGFNTDAIEPWLEYWANEYDFSAREAFFNQFPQYKTNIQGLDIHYIHIRPEVSPSKEVVPLVLLHGWPGSIREFYETIPLITAVSDDRDFVVELIVPCLPGFGFSDGAVIKGMGGGQVAIIIRNLMQRLNHKQYYIQGGDWGGIIGSLMCTLFPDEVLGFHTNFGFVSSEKAFALTLLGNFFPELVVDNATESRMYPLSEKLGSVAGEMAYFYMQATKPDTIGVGLTDSPAGLLAYILEKFSTGTNFENLYSDDGGFSKTFTKDQLIDNLMMYWMPRSITTSIRLYAEGFSKANRALKLESIPTTVPTWVIQAKHEFIYQSEKILRTKFINLLNTTVLDFGGHFFALEQPEYFAQSVLYVLDKFRQYHEQV